ncbi:outer membrane beta-barrel protein [Segatella maculosa]|uniref:outer membrane beta-barrel protein n=1 Tax=Segatella maculosa TaxID=439703 RepID=UPI0023F3B138|nr:outer membrane beta-barrel protein [Segatella maculosa]
MRRIFLLLLSVPTFVVSSVAATTPALVAEALPGARHFGIQQTDTVARDLSELEEALADSTVAQQDTAYYGAPRQKNFNALNYVLDSRHRFKGDQYVNRGFLGNTYFHIGGGVGHFYENSNQELYYTPIMSFRLGLGKELSPMSSFRVGLEKSWGYTNPSAGVFNTNQYNSYGGYVDFLYNFSNYLLGYRPERPFSVSGIVGLGFRSSSMHSWKNPGLPDTYAYTSGTSFDGHVGFQFKFFASPHASFGFEPYFKVASTKYNLLTNPGYSDPDFAYGMNLMYQWYFDRQLSDKAHAGVFMKRFNNDLRYLSDNGQLKHLRFPVFFDYGFGSSFMGKTDGLSLLNTKGFDASAAVGWWLAPAVGIRSGIHVTNADWKDGTLSRQPVKYMIGTNGFNFDFLFNPFGFRRHYNWDSNFGLNLLAGYEFGRLKKTTPGFANSFEGNYTAFRLGGQLWMKLTNDLRLTLEPTYMPIQHYNGNLDRARYDEYALKLGLSVLFRDKAIRNYHVFGTDSVSRDSIKNTPLSGFFAGVGLGWNNTVWDWRFSGYQHDLFKNVLAFGGYRFNPIHGVRLQGEWMKESLAYYGNTLSGIDKYRFENYLFSLDYQLNLSNMMAGYDPLRRWNVYLYAGPTLLMGNGGTDFAANVGGMLSYNVSRRAALFINHTVYRMPQNRYPYHTVYSKEGTFTNNFNIGMMYNFDGTEQIFDAATQSKFFFEYTFGSSYTGRTSLGFRNTRGFDATASLGWWFSSAFAARSGFHVTNADWASSSYAGHSTKLLVGTRGATFDLLINPFGFTNNFNWDQRFGVNLIGGYELGHAKRTDPVFVNSYEGNYTGFRAGAQLWARLSNGLRFTVEPMFSSIKQKGENGINYDAYALKAGVSLLLKSKAERNYGEVAEDSVRNTPLKGYFAGAGLGWSNTLWDWRFTGHQHGLLKNATFFGGYRFNTLHGVRLQGEWKHEKVAAPGYSDPVDLKYDNYLLSLDYQLNLYNLMAGYDPARRWNVYLSAGPTLLMGNGGTDFAANVGAMLTYNLSRHTSLFYSYSVYRMPKNRYPHSMVYSKDGTYTNNLNVGVMYNFDGTEQLFDAAKQSKFFFEYAFGPSYTGRTSLGFRNTRGFDANVALGWWFSSAFALRSGFHVTNADWASSSYAGHSTKLLVGTRGAAFDLLVNPFGFVREYNWEPRFGVNLLGGYEFGHAKRTVDGFVNSYEGNYSAFRVGAQFWARLSNGLRFTVEPIYAPVTQHGNGGIDYNEYALKMGFSMLLKNKEERVYEEVDEANRKNIATKGYFLGAGLGWNSTVWDWRFTGHQHDLLKNATIFGGYHFNTLHSVRLQADWMKEKVAYPGHSDLTDLNYNNYLLSLDYQLNLYNLMAGYDPARRWNAYLYAGPTLLMGDGGTKVAANVGGMFTYNVTPSLGLFYSHTVYRMPKNRYPHSMIYSENGTYTNNLNIGLMYTFDALRKLFGQGEPSDDEVRRSPLFFEYGFGPAFMSKTPLGASKTTGFDAKVALGWWANSAIGLRGGFRVTNANWDEGTYASYPVTYLIGTRGFMADLMINPLGFKSNYNWDSAFGLNLFAGYEFGHSKKTVAGFVNSYEGGYTAFRVGGQLWAKLTNDLRLTLEPTYTPLKLKNISDNRHNRFALQMGISLLMRNKADRDYDEKDIEGRHNLPLEGLFVGAGFGWNNTLWQWKFSEQKSDLLKNAMAFAGYNFTTVHALRLQGEWMKEKMVYPHVYDLTTLNFTNYLVSLDYQVNLFNAMTGYDPARRWNVYLYAGPTLLLGDGGTKAAMNFGGQFSYSVARNLSLFYSHTVYRMPEGRYPHSLPYTKSGTFTNNINIGVMYNFNSFSK